MTTTTYKCGHPSRLADGRRGKTRQAIVAKITSSDCPLCRLTALAARLTKLDGTPYTAEEQAAYVQKRLPRIS